MLLASAQVLNQGKSDQDDNFLGYLLDDAVNGPSPAVREQALLLIGKVVNGDPEKKFADARHDLATTKTVETVMRRAEEEPDLETRRSAAYVLQAVTANMDDSAITDTIYNGASRLAVQEKDLQARGYNYETRLEVLPRAYHLLTPEIVAELAQPTPDDNTKQMEHKLYAIRGHVLTSQNEKATPDLVEEFIRHCRAVSYAGDYRHIMFYAPKTPAIIEGMKRAGKDDDFSAPVQPTWKTALGNFFHRPKR